MEPTTQREEIRFRLVALAVVLFVLAGFFGLSLIATWVTFAYREGRGVVQDKGLYSIRPMAGYKLKVLLSRRVGDEHYRDWVEMRDSKVTLAQSRPQADAVLNQVQIGQDLNCYYDPLNPAQVRLESAPAYVIFMCSLAGPLFTLFILLAAFGDLVVSRRRSRPSAPQLPVGAESAPSRPEPLVVAQETATGVRYVPPADAPREPTNSLLSQDWEDYFYARPFHARRLRTGLSPGFWMIIYSFGLLAAAVLFAVSTLALASPFVPASHVGWALLYLLQLVLDMAALSRYMWRSILRSLGDREIELAGGRLRAGIRWGWFWLDARSVPIDNIRRLVVVRRPGTDWNSLTPGAWTDWDLVAEMHAGAPLSLICSKDTPEQIRAIAGDLHQRIGASRAQLAPWPPLVEENGPRTAAATPLRSLVPAGGCGWFLVHVAGCVGLVYLGMALAQIPSPLVWLTAFLPAAVLLQVFLFVINLIATSEQANRYTKRIEAASRFAEESESNRVIPPEMIQVGNQAIAVDNTPLLQGRRRSPDLFIGPHALPTVVQKNSHSLVIKRSARGYGCLLLTVPLGGAGTLLFAAAAFSGAVRWALHMQGWPTWVLVVLAFGFLFWLLLWNIPGCLRQLFGGGRVRFDVSTGLMTFGPVWSRQSRPLSEIAAVQLLADKLPLPSTKTEAASDCPPIYQLNLVLADANTPRCNVALSANRDWTQQAGKQLAEFLSVPLVNYVAGNSSGVMEMPPTDGSVPTAG